MVGLTENRWADLLEYLSVATLENKKVELMVALREKKAAVWKVELRVNYLVDWMAGM